MTSVLVLEQPGRWRGLASASLLLVLALPLLPLWKAAFDAPGDALGPAYWRSLRTSIELGLGGSFIGLLLGLPLGVGSALTAFRGKRLLLVLLSLPLVVPSFLWAIGWSNLGAVSGDASGFLGCLLVGATTTTALVVFASYAGTLEVSRSQLEAALLAGGEATLLRAASRHALLPAVLAAAFGSVLTLSDAGPGQILGVHTVAAEILTTFAARYDLPVAAKQCSVLMLVVASLTLPLAWIAGPRIARAVLAKQLRSPLPGRRDTITAGVAIGLAAFLALAVLPPVLGLLVPLIGGGETLRARWIGDDAWTGNHISLALLAAGPLAARTAFNSFLYAGGAGLIATLIAALLALSAGRSATLRAAILAASLVLFSWPSVASALGVAQLAASAPAALDSLLRSRLTVCIVLALHLAPVAVVLLLRGMGAVPSSWTFAAAIHGVDLRRYALRVLWPALLPSAAIAFPLVALLASADAGSTLLLHPPGEGSLGLAIVTVMANAPEAFVSALCLIYLLVATVALMATFGFASSRTPR